MKHPVYCGSKKKIRAEREKDRKDKQTARYAKLAADMDRMKQQHFNPAKLGFSK